MNQKLLSPKQFLALRLFAYLILEKSAVSLALHDVKEREKEGKHGGRPAGNGRHVRSRGYLPRLPFTNQNCSDWLNGRALQWPRNARWSATRQPHRWRFMLICVPAEPPSSHEVMSWWHADVINTAWPSGRPYVSRHWLSVGLHRAIHCLHDAHQTLHHSKLLSYY